MFCFGSVATDACSPVSTRILPTLGCSIRNAGTGILSHSSFGDANAPPRLPGAPVLAMNSAGESMYPVLIGWTRTVAPSCPPGRGCVSRLASASAILGRPYCARRFRTTLLMLFATVSSRWFRTVLWKVASPRFSSRSSFSFSSTCTRIVSPIFVGRKKRTFSMP